MTILKSIIYILNKIFFCTYTEWTISINSFEYLEKEFFKKTFQTNVVSRKEGRIILMLVVL